MALCAMTIGCSSTSSRLQGSCSPSFFASRPQKWMHSTSLWHQMIKIPTETSSSNKLRDTVAGGGPYLSSSDTNLSIHFLSKMSRFTSCAVVSSAQSESVVFRTHRAKHRLAAPFTILDGRHVVALVGM